MITLTYENEDCETIIFKVPEDVTSTELAEVFSRFMMAVGYSPSNVDELFGED